MDFEMLKPYAIEAMKKDEIKTYVLQLIQVDGVDDISFKQYKIGFDAFLQSMKDNSKVLSEEIEKKESEITTLTDQLKIATYQQNNIFKDAQEKIEELNLLLVDSANHKLLLSNEIDTLKSVNNDLNVKIKLSTKEKTKKK